MSAMTNYHELGMLDYWFNNVDFAKPAGLAISWHSGNPGDGGSLANEVDLTGGGPAGRVTATFNNSTNRVVGNNTEINIPSVANPGEITYWALHRTDGALEMLCYTLLDAPLSLSGGEPVRINPNGMLWDFPDDDEVFSDFLVNSWLSHVYGSNTATRPTQWFVGLHTGDPGSAGTNLEFTGGGYVRQSVTWGNAETEAPWSRVRNNNQLDFVNLTQTPISWWTVFDSLTTGNMLARRNQPPDTVTPGSNASAGAQTLILRVD